MEDQKAKRIKEKLFYGSIIFGISIPIGLLIMIHFGAEIEHGRENVSMGKNALLWALEWVFILVGIGLPWITWEKLVKPFKNF